MRYPYHVIALTALVTLAGGCASSNERVVYVPSIDARGTTVGDPLGLRIAQLAAKPSTKSAPAKAAQAQVAPAPVWAPSTVQTAIAVPITETTTQRTAQRLPERTVPATTPPQAVAQKPQAPAPRPQAVASKPQPAAAWRPEAEKNIRTPLVTFATTDGPSAD